MRLFTDGAETGNTSAFDVVNNAEIASSDPRSGTYNYQFGQIDHYARITLPSQLSEVYLRFGMQITSSGVLGGVYLKSNSASTLEGYLRTTPSGTLQVTRGGTQIDIGTQTLTNGVWYLIEIYFKVDSSTGRWIVKIDGVTDIDFTGNTQNSNNYIDTVEFHDYTSNYLWIDDIAINDTSGGEDDSWCGDGRIVALIPNGNGYTNDWLGSDADQTDNYQLVDELPPSDSDYVTSSGVDEVDAYDLSTLTLTGKTVERVWVVSRAKSDTSEDYFYQGIRVNGTDYVISGALPTSFQRVEIPQEDAWKVSPDTSVEWTQAEIDALQLILKSHS